MMRFSMPELKQLDCVLNFPSQVVTDPQRLVDTR
ncbi:TPA: hypothetical protein N0F65_012974 [Lagenidium giganteum]|uniref:Uncharacterized protein n=1 Tax=Lagenidium giganteum TaxID=4803 RepID=A0AAV2Z0H6_9STRA|nr:TPA: hypothetical protein N0F65_012974 [Lagenidium giganteum]